MPGNLEWLDAKADGGYTRDLRSLIKVAEAFANRNVSLHAYDYVKNLTADDWNAVRARFYELLRTYALWWSQPSEASGHRPPGLCDFLDRPFVGPAAAAGSWDLLTLGLDAASQADQLLAAEVTLWRLWRNAKQAWRERMNVPDYARTADTRVPTFIVVDEAHNFAPAAATDDPLRRRVADRLIQIASEGRKYGLYLILATQRPTKLHPELVPECENSCVLRVQSAREQDFASNVLGIPREFVSAASRFVQGQGLLSGRWVGQGPIDTIAAPARVTVGGGGVGSTWRDEPDDVEPTADGNELASTLRSFIEAELRASGQPLTLVSLANMSMRMFPGVVGPDGSWLGTGSFKGLLRALGVPGLELLLPPPGYAYLEGVHDPTVVDAAQRRVYHSDSDLPAIAERVTRETGVPLLSSAQFSKLFRTLAQHLETDEFNLARVARGVRDRLQALDDPVSRSAVEFVIKGIAFSGHRYGTDLPQDAGTLARAFYDNVLRLLDVNDVELDAADRMAIEEWIVAPTLLGDVEDASELAEAPAMAEGAGVDG